MNRTQPSHSDHSQKITPLPRFELAKPLRLTLPIHTTMTVMNGWQAASVGDGVQLKFDRSPGAGHHDAHIVRERFLLIGDLRDAQRFFSKYGPLSRSESKDVTHSMLEIQWRQSEIRTVREMESERYFNPQGDEHRLFFESLSLTGQLLYRDAPFLDVRTHDVLNAIRSANYVDHIGGVRAATCPLCGRQFSWGPKDKKRTYCVPEHQAAAAKDRYNREHRKGPYAKAGK